MKRNIIEKLGYTFLLLFIVMVPAIAVPVGRAASPANEPDVARMDSFVRRQMQRHNLPGLALAIVDGERVVFSQGYGKAGPAGRAVTPQTPFLLASVSKPLTAFAVMQLVEAGQIELDAPVRRYLPEFRVDDPAASEQITVRHLLLHTSGLPVTACDTRRNAQTLAEYVSELRTVKLDAPVGARHMYCSGNYNVLGRIIEVMGGQSFGSYMQAQVFAPLAMNHSFTGEAEARQAGMAQGYQWFFGLPVATRPRYNPSQLPSGMMISSAEDLGRFLIIQLNGGRSAGGSQLSPEGIAAMQTTGVRRAGKGGYGLGWVIAPVGDVPAVWHDGVGVNTHTLLLMQPETGRGAVLLFNSFGIVPYSSAYPEIEAGVARLLAGQEPAEESGLSLGALYGLVDLILLVGLGLAAWPLLRLRRWQRAWIKRRAARRHSLGREMLRPVLEILGAIGFLAAVRLFVGAGMGAQSWGEALEGFPDFVVWIWAVALLILLAGIGRAALVLKERRSKSEPVVAAPTTRPA